MTAARASSSSLRRLRRRLTDQNPMPARTSTTITSTTIQPWPDFVDAPEAVPVAFIDDAALLAVQPRCPTRSAVAERETGFASVAEGAALAASGGRLLLARIAGGGATCALAGP